MFVLPCRKLAPVAGLVVALALQPWAAAAAQEAPPDLPATVAPAAPSALVPTPPASTTALSAVEALRSVPDPTILAGGGTELSSVPGQDDALAVAMQQSGNGRGKVFMIAGAAALVGGLIVGGDLGTVIAAGGVVLGVYGVILYF